MRSAIFTALALGLVWLSGCTGLKQTAGNEYDDIYYTSADAKADQEAREANIASSNAATPANNSQGNGDATRYTSADQQPVATGSGSYDRARMAKTGENEEFYYDDRNWDNYEDDDFYYSRRIRRFSNRGAGAGWGYYDPYFSYDPYYVINTPTWSYYQNDPWWYDPFYYRGPSYSWTYGWGRPGYAYYPSQFNSWGNCFGCNNFNSGWGNPGWGNSWNYYSVSYGTTGYYYSSGWSSYYGGGYGGYYSQSYFNGGAGYNPCAYGAGYQGWAFGGTTNSNSTTTYAPRPTTSSLGTNSGRPPLTVPAQSASATSEQTVRPYQTPNPQTATSGSSLPTSITGRPGRPSTGSTITNTYNPNTTTNSVNNPRGNTVTSRPNSGTSTTGRPNSTISQPANTTRPTTNTYSTRPSKNTTGTPRGNSTIERPSNNSVTPRNNTPNTTRPSNNYNRPKNNSTPSRNYNTTRPSRNTSRPSRNYNSTPSRSSTPSRNYNSSPSRSSSSTPSRSYSSPSRSSGSSTKSSGSRSSSPSRSTGGTRKR